jgi:UTP--glucose-1-phosphate uridylyltransferase
MLNKLVVIKLNGGLGTTMGCVGPKSLIQVRNDETFLDLTVQQIEQLNHTYNTKVPLVLMNSFNTESETARVRHKYESRVPFHTFEQSCYPRINQETLRPVPEKPDLHEGEWYPPGHGDIYISLKRSGLLDKFMKQGKEIIFVSNIDNLGATVDLKILNYLLKNPCEFVMEVTDKTRSDVKGGTLIEYEGKVRLLEIAQVPKDKIDEFKSISKFKVFNTNNLWMKMSSINDLLGKNEISMELIMNKKITSSGLNVIQLETAVGAAIKNFKTAIGINVPRTRFLPVKQTSDLLVVMSNLFKLDKGTLIMNPTRSVPTLPLVKLGGSNFYKVKDFLGRFDDIPNMLELDHLTVSGDVTFGKGVILKGTVIIIANHGDRIDIPSGAYLENKIVSGNLRILDH